MSAVAIASKPFQPSTMYSIILPYCHQVEQLTNHLKEKTDKCSELLLSKEQLQRDIQERNEEIEKLECRIRELEQALIISADNLQKVLFGLKLSCIYYFLVCLRTKQYFFYLFVINIIYI